MASLYPAHVRILPTYGESKIIGEIEGTIRKINVCISTNTILNGSQDFRHLLSGFAIHLNGCNVIRFEVDNVPDAIVDVFKCVYMQIDNGVNLRNVVDDYGRPLFRSEQNGMYGNQASSQIPSHVNFPQAANAVLQTINSGNPPDRNQWQRLVTDLGSSLIGLAQQPNASAMQSSRAGSMYSNSSSSLPSNSFHPFTNQPSQPIYSGNPRIPVQNHPRQVPQQQTPQPQESQNRVPVQPNTLESTQRNMLGLLGQLGQIASLVSRNNSSHQTQLPPSQPIRREPQVQQSQPNNISDDLDSPYLQRFVENRQGATREIIPIVENAVSVNQPDHSTIPSIPAMPSSPPSSTIQVDQAAGLQRVSNTAHTSAQNTENETKSRTDHRTEVSRATLGKLAAHINAKILANKTKPPNFTKSTRTNLCKIKNYIHHHTKVWLNKNEIEIFITELTKINPALTSQEIDLQLD